ncbi:MAG: hypothetical protein KGV51_07305 [Moraxellaceae bacterium]|nr:hypothetical protein [Moraxellaceae bacterium]
MKKIGILLLALSMSAVATAKTTPIKFAKGSYCGSYSGNFTHGKKFSLVLKANQELVTRNTEYGFYDVHVKAPNGRTLRGKVDIDHETMYTIHTTTRSGRHTIYVKSTEPYNSIEFCAY